MASKKLIAGGRYLMSRTHGYSVEEHTIEEVSPSKKRFKTGGVWHSTDDWYVEEVLPFIPEGGKPKDSP